MNRVTQLIDEAVALAQANQMAAAEAILDDLAAFTRDSGRQADVFRLIGSIRLLDGRTKGGIEALTRAVELNPDDADARSNLCEGLRRNGQVAAAVEQGRKAVALNPNSSRACNNLGFALQEGDELEESIRWLKQSHALEPDYENAIANFGLSYMRQGQIDEAIRTYERGIAIHPENARLHT
ncbi:MAG: tetratricopeptide repeat protein, partial [Verrucomicrobiae bacterium]|nr:tetratricopeptide repeat protein [Verrucomicrobiae bacterium]